MFLDFSAGFPPAIQHKVYFDFFSPVASDDSAIDKRELTYLVMQLVLVVTVEEEVRLEMKTGSTTQACVNRPNMGCHESQPRKKEDISSELRSRRSSDRGDDDFLVPSHDHHFIYASPPLSLSLSSLFFSKWVNATSYKYIQNRLPGNQIPSIISYPQQLNTMIKKSFII